MTVLEAAITDLFKIAVLALIGLLLGLGSFDAFSAYLRRRRRKKEERDAASSSEEWR
jgi:hypothetical protein